MKMRKNFPNEYDFFPQTWLLPAEMGDFRSQFVKGKITTFIIKPEASCQGKVKKCKIGNIFSKIP